MNKIFLFIYLFAIFIFSLDIQSIEYDKLTKDRLEYYNVYYGNPSENKIVGSNDMFVIMHNPTEFAINVMHQGAIEYCNNQLQTKNYTSVFWQILFKYTVYFSCEMKNPFLGMELSQKEKECINNRNNRYLMKKNDQVMAGDGWNEHDCEKIIYQNIEIINLLENDNKYKTQELIYAIRAEFYDEILTLEQIAENNIAKSTIKENINTCKQYTFEEGSEFFYKCLLMLIRKNNLSNDIID